MRYMFYFYFNETLPHSHVLQQRYAIICCPNMPSNDWIIEIHLFGTNGVTIDFRAFLFNALTNIFIY